MRLALVPKHLGELVVQVRMSSLALGIGVDRGEAVIGDAEVDVPRLFVEPYVDLQTRGLGVLLGHSVILPSLTPALTAARGFRIRRSGNEAPSSPEPSFSS